MLSRNSLILFFALAACEDPQPQNTSASNEVISLSRDAVAIDPVVEPVDGAARDDGVLLGSAMMSDAVPIASSEPTPEVASPEVAPVPMAVYTLRHGETLDHFARWSGYAVEDIAGFSGLSLDGEYAVGTTIQLPVQDDAAAAIDLARAEHWSKRLDGYLASRGGAVGTEFYQVRTGDSAWGIARHTYAIPMWVLEMYNPSVDLDALRPGQELMVPKLADVVVDAQTDLPEVSAPETGEPAPQQ